MLPTSQLVSQSSLHHAGGLLALAAPTIGKTNPTMTANLAMVLNLDSNIVSLLCGPDQPPV
jgi:hypothetical protein